MTSGNPARPALAEPAFGRSPDGSLAWTGLLLGAIGLFVLNLVFGPLAIGLGVTALRHTASRHGGSSRGAAVIAIALGVADVAVLAALALGSVAHGGLVWHFGA